MEDRLMRLSKKPRVQIMIVLHEFNDVVMRLCIDHWICGKRIRTGKGLDDGIIDVGILGDCKGLVGGEETLEEGEKGWHIGVLESGLIDIVQHGTSIFYEARMGLFFNAH